MAKQYRVGLIPIADPKAGGEFAHALSSVLGVTVAPHHAADYRGVLAALEQGLVHMAWLPPWTAARAVRAGSLVPAAVTMRNGTATYAACLFALKTARIQGLADLAGARVAWVDRESASGYLVVRAAMRARGIRIVDAFAEESFARSHAEVARAVAQGRADVGATFVNFQSGSDTIDRAGWRDGGVKDDDVNVLLRAGPIPADMFAVHPSVPEVALRALQAALVDARPAVLHNVTRTLLHADGFARPTDEHLQMLRALAALIEPPVSSIPPPAR